MAGANFYFIGGINRLDHGNPLSDKADKVKSIILIIATGLILLGGTFLFTIVLPIEWNSVFLLMAGLLIVLTIIVHQINSFAFAKEGRSVIIPYLITIILKLILGSIMLIVLLRLNQEMARELVISFLVYYSAFTALEIIMINKRLSAHKL